MLTRVTVDIVIDEESYSDILERVKNPRPPTRLLRQLMSGLDIEWHDGPTLLGWNYGPADGLK